MSQNLMLRPVTYCFSNTQKMGEKVQKGSIGVLMLQIYKTSPDHMSKLVHCNTAPTLH